MVENGKSNYFRYVVWTTGLVALLLANGPLEAAAVEGNGTTLLNPFSLQVIQVQPRQQSGSIVVLRSTSSRVASALNQPAPASGNRLTLQSSGLIFRNSVVRVPLMPEVRSPSSPD